MTDHPPLKRLLLTGASGGMGTALRPMLTGLAQTVVVSGRSPIADLLPHEESIPCDLSNAAEVDALVKGCDGIIHLGGYSVEGPFDPIMQANILGLYNLYEAARAHGQPRILFASSNHVVGYYRQDQVIDASAPPRPDSLYGVSKVFGEALARFYFEKFGQETAILRIGSCFDHPTDHRMLASWLSYRDFLSFAERVFTVGTLGCPIVFGSSNNDRSLWDNSAVAQLGWQPQDNAERFAAQVSAAHPDPDPNAPLHVFQGGAFTELPLYKDSDND